MQNLLIRALSGSIYVALVIFACLGHSYGPSLLMLLFASISIFEWQSLRPQNFEFKNYLSGLILFLILALLFSPLFTLEEQISQILQFLLGLVFCSFILIQSFSQRKDAISVLSHNALGLIYIFPALLLIAKFPWTLGQEEPWLLLSVFILIWSSDTFAYLSGRFLGKNKLFERISPKKTWEGFIGGLVFTLGSAVLLEYSLGIMSIVEWMGLALLVGIAGSLGDLFESAIKRSFKVKDSGSFIPGHGGILDRIDSLLVVLPLAYLYLSLLSNIG
tara:strand:- start:84 stop:908 length:825 start_codon:yes stop_codon:yes gene_type:complete